MWNSPWTAKTCTCWACRRAERAKRYNWITPGGQTVYGRSVRPYLFNLDKFGKFERKPLTNRYFCDKMTNCIIIASRMGRRACVAVPGLAIRRRLCILTKARVTANRLSGADHGCDRGICRAPGGFPVRTACEVPPFCAVTVFRSLCPLRRRQRREGDTALSGGSAVPPCPRISRS